VGLRAGAGRDRYKAGHRRDHDKQVIGQRRIQPDHSHRAIALLHAHYRGGLACSLTLKEPADKPALVRQEKSHHSLGHEPSGAAKSGVLSGTAAASPVPRPSPIRSPRSKTTATLPPML
jgi:hypothetical protein